MRYLTFVAALTLPFAPALAQEAAKPAVEPKPAALVADGMPEVPAELAAATRPYMENRGAGFVGWNPIDRSMLISTRFGNTNQIHRVAMPMGARKQLTFEAEPVGSAAWSPKSADIMLLQKDVGGNEFYQIYAMKNGRLELLTDGKSRNSYNAWSKDGSLLAFTSTRRNGRDSDIYLMNPRDAASSKMIAQVSGGGWGVSDIAPDKSWALVGKYVSVQKTDLYRLDLRTGAICPIAAPKKAMAS
ncbi:MAG: PD40 domain-containing protein, partial [Sphingopyxis sp.]|nr:PD40 domain-containing protein [Sphingopyxis sp.]